MNTQIAAKSRKNLAEGRSESTNVSPNMLKLMKNVVNEANVHLTGLIERDPEVAVVSPREQPDFMHNLLFR